MPAPSYDSYEESTAYQWTENAFEMLERGELLGEAISREGVLRSRVWGPCPRCAHFLDDHQVHTAITNVFGGESRGPGSGWREADNEGANEEYYQVDVSCSCQSAHGGAPAGRAGCGVSFRVELLVQAGRNSTRQ